MQTRRSFLAAGAAGLAGAALAGRAAAQYKDPAGLFNLEGGDFSVTPIRHASFVLETPESVIYVDPVGGADLYEGLPEPDLILVTHAHSDHFDADTLQALVDVGAGTSLVTNPAVYRALPPELRARAVSLDNFGTADVKDVNVRAVPAYNVTPDRMQFYPEGRDNGYVLTVDAVRIYIAGDTEAIPEMADLPLVDVAFLPMNLPYTMSVEQAVEVVRAVEPAIVYPYHYRGSDPGRFADLVREAGLDTEVRLLEWYP